MRSFLFSLFFLVLLTTSAQAQSWLYDDIYMGPTQSIFQNGVRQWHTYGTANVFIGSFAAAGNRTLTGTNDVAVGSSAGAALTYGTANVLLGNSAGTTLTGGGNNTYLGHHAGNNASHAMGNNNVFVGGDAAKAVSGSTSFSNVAAMGHNVLSGAGSLSDVFTTTSNQKWLSGTYTNNGRDQLQVNGSMVFKYASGSAAPTTSNIASGECILWKETTGGTTKWYCNDGGVIKAGAAFN